MKLPIREVKHDLYNKKKSSLFSILHGKEVDKKVPEKTERIINNEEPDQEGVETKEQSEETTQQQAESNEKVEAQNQQQTEESPQPKESILKKSWTRLKTSSNLQSVFIITFFLLLSKAMGFLRSVLILDRMDKISSDLLIAASKVPEIITLVLVMGTVASSLLPMSSRIKEERGEKKMVDFMNLFQAPLVVVMGLVTVVFYIYAEPILKATTSPEYWNIFVKEGLASDYVKTAQILLLGPIVFALQSFFGVYLSIKKRFFVYSLAGVVSNAGAIVGLLISGNNGYLQTAKGMVIGAGVATLLYWLNSINLGFSYKLKLITFYKEFKKEFWEIWRIFIPRMFIISGVVVSGLLINLITDTRGQVTSLEFAIAVQSIFLVLINSLGTVVFPDLSSLWNQRESRQKFWNSLKYYTENTAIVAIGGGIITFLTVGLVMWFITLFTEGQGTNDYIIFLTRVLALGLVFQSVNEILTKYFYIRHRTWQPVMISLLALGIQVGLTFFLDSNVGMDAAIAVALGVVVNFFVTTVISLYLIRKDYNLEMKKVTEI